MTDKSQVVDFLLGRRRRTKRQMALIKEAIYKTCKQQRRTVRGLFYALVSQGMIEKTEADYKGLVVRLCTEMRERGELPWAWIADTTRLMRKPDSYNSLEEALENCRDYYRRDLWQEQAAYVEVWCEKSAMEGLLYTVTSKWDVPLMVSRGFSSIGFVHSAAVQIEARNKPAFIYYLGDHDPSGLEIESDINFKLTKYTDDADITFKRIAVTPEQIAEYNLLTRPTKESNHSRDFEGESVELDAMPPDQLLTLLEDAITQHIDQRQLSIVQLAEQSERNMLEQIIESRL